jgi:hypothetical protein
VKYRCQGITYSSDKDFIRAQGKGASRDESTAHRMAFMDASVNLAKAVEAYRQKITTYQDKSQAEKDTQSIEWENESFSREKLNRNLKDMRTVCSQTRRKDNRYIITLIVEISGRLED